MRRILLLAIALSLAGCAGKPFDVKVVPRVEPERIGPAVAAGPLAVRAQAIWDEDWLLETFDANLVLARVLAVRVDVENTGAEPVETKKIDFDAAGPNDVRFKPLSAKKARKRIESYYGIAIRGKTGDKIYKADFEANALDLRRPLAPGERRQGLLFLEIPEGVERRVPVRLVVTPRKSAPVSIAL